MISLSIQSLETEKILLETESPFSRNRGLVAQWVLEDGKLVCHWFLAQG